jgi:hypothetical protein
MFTTPRSDLLRRFAVTLAALGLVTMAHAQATLSLPKAGPNAPAGVPADYVITPSGYMDPNCVNRVAKGEKVRSDGNIEQVDGTVRKVPTCNSPRFTRSGQRIAPTIAHAIEPDFSSGIEPSTNPDIDHAWIESASITLPAGSEVRRMIGSWTAPSNPSLASSNATIFFFPGLEDATNVQGILQPVLGYNAYGVNHIWTIASWNCCIANTADASDAVQVETGDKIYGEMVMDCAVGTDCGKWNVITTDTTTGASTTLSDTPTTGQVQTWAVGYALEVYSVTSCRDYPADGSNQIYNLAMWDLNNNPVTSNWNGTGVVTGFSPNCLYHVDATNPTSITLSY